MSNKPTITPSNSNLNIPTWYDHMSGTFERSDSENGTTSEDSMEDTEIAFLVPEGYTADLSASLTVDDWGKLTITDDKGAVHLTVSMTSAESSAGDRGGHEEWTRTGSANLPSGKYTILVHHENITYTGQYADKSIYNISKCNFSIDATKKRARQKVTTTSKVIVKAHRPQFEFNRPITLSAVVTWENDTPNFSDIAIEKFDRSPVVVVDNKGRTNQIAIEDVTAQFAGDTVIDESKHVAYRTANISWKARVWDYADPNYTDEGRVIEANSTSDGAPGNPAFAITLE